MHNIPFTNNWNNKLNNQFFTTIRLYNLSKYQVGNMYQIMLKKEVVFYGKIIQLRYCKIDELPEITCYQDTGLNKQNTIALIKNFYPTVTWSQQLLTLILIQNINYTPGVPSVML